jgi:hypothetical protein
MNVFEGETYEETRKYPVGIDDDHDDQESERNFNNPELKDWRNSTKPAADLGELVIHAPKAAEVMREREQAAAEVTQVAS